MHSCLVITRQLLERTILVLWYIFSYQPGSKQLVPCTVSYDVTASQGQDGVDLGEGGSLRWLMSCTSLQQGHHCGRVEFAQLQGSLPMLQSSQHFLVTQQPVGQVCQLHHFPQEHTVSPHVSCTAPRILLQYCLRGQPSQWDKTLVQRIIFTGIHIATQRRSRYFELHPWSEEHVASCQVSVHKSLGSQSLHAGRHLLSHAHLLTEGQGGHSCSSPAVVTARGQQELLQVALNTRKQHSHQQPNCLYVSLSACLPALRSVCLSLSMTILFTW